MKTCTTPRRGLGVLALALVLGATAGCGGKKRADMPPGCPKFSTTSDQPVTLRYKFQPGQKVKMDVDMDMSMRMSGEGQKLNIEMPMKIEGIYEVKGIDEDGNAEVVTTITRMKMKVTGGPQDISFDSATGSSHPQFKPLMKMLDVPIPVKVSPAGKLLEANLDALRDAAGGAASAAEAIKNMEKVQQSSFVPLPDKPVKAGDTYDAGEIVQDMPNVGKMKTRTSYKVVSVSGDKKQVILRPSADFSLDTSAGGKAKVTLEKGNMDGWLLFDIEKGNILRSSAVVQMAMKMSVGGKTMRMNLDAEVKYRTTEQ